MTKSQEEVSRRSAKGKQVRKEIFFKLINGDWSLIIAIKAGSVLDFGDYTSSFMTGQAWRALEKDDVDSVIAYTNKVISMYEEKAKEMQESLTEYPWQSREQVFNYWALNDVGTALFIQGEALKRAGENEKARVAYKKLIDKYYYAQCWDPQGWFWKPAEAAQQSLDALADS